MKKVVLVTGSTSGIGRGIATVFARNGYDVMIHGLEDDLGHNLQKDLSETYKARISYCHADLSQEQECEKLVAEALRMYGRLDVLVNNAGIQHVSPVETFSSEKWRSVLDINLSSAFYTIKAALPTMYKQQEGRIINIASAHGLVASAQKSAYVAAKHGLVGLTKVVALETAGKGITCNAICPGWVLTPLVQKQIEDRARNEGKSFEEAKQELLFEKQPSGEFVTVEQIGEVALFLSSSAASQITGSSLPVDGGWTSR